MKSELDRRKVPDILDGVTSLSEWNDKREKIKKLLQEEEYGYIPKSPWKISFSEEIVLKNFGAGKADLKKITVTSYIGEKSFSFPVYSTVPLAEGKYPAFVHINFRDSVPDRYLPSEEILDNGFAVFSFCYKDITSDDGDFTSGLAGVLFEDGKRTGSDCGKIAMWAWAAMRVMDYIQSLGNIDKSKISVCGHSRLGKTALLTAAFDERFYTGFSNNSGCSGAALSRGKSGESIDDICERFPYWFCENYYKYRNKEETLPFDQHFLLALIAPRYAYIASAEEDLWADPESEQLTAFAASSAWDLYGRKGFICKDRFAKVGEFYHKGSLGYHKRSGTHYFSRGDWIAYIDFLKKKNKK